MRLRATPQLAEGDTKLTRYRSKRNKFTPEELKKHSAHFWAMPSAWGQAGGMLASVWKTGGSGAVSILPVLGQFAKSGFRDDLVLSVEEIARLAGVDPATAARGGKALVEIGLVEDSYVAPHFGNPVTRWILSPQLAFPLEGGAPDYFYFSSRLLYGGNWARLTSVQRAVYLAIGAQARAYDAEPTDNQLLNAVLPSQVSRLDFSRCFDTSAADSRERFLRLAAVSFSDLAASTGICKSALHVAVNGLKHPAVWPDAEGDPRTLVYQPLGVYRTTHGILLYHLRDHAPPWPWEMLNEPRASTRPASQEEWFELV